MKNINKNPVAERAIQELEHEILRLDPTGGQITAFQLSAVVSQLNCHIRGSRMSAREMLFQRDQFLNTQLPIEDHKLALQQHQRRLANHQSSASSKAPTCTSRDHCPDISIGDLVYLFNDKNKHKGRDRYLVVSCDGQWCNIWKFVGNQLRSNSYCVKRSECYKVAPHTREPHMDCHDAPGEECEDEPAGLVHCHFQPEVVDDPGHPVDHPPPDHPVYQPP